MRFMMLMIPRVYQAGQKIDEGFAPSAEAVAAMMKYNQELAATGALISLEGLQPPAKGARVSFAGGKPIVTDGPFPETKEVLGGYWMIQAGSLAEAVEWARRVPAEPGDVVEVRQVFEMADFPEDVQRAADNPTVREQVAR